MAMGSSPGRMAQPIPVISCRTLSRVKGGMSGPMEGLTKVTGKATK